MTPGLRLYDAEAGEARGLALRHPRLLGLRVRGGLRAYVVADLVRRLAEHRKLRVWLDGEDAQLEFNVHPGRGPSPAGTDLDVVGGGAEPDPDAGRRLRVGPLNGDVAGDPLAVRLVLLRTPYRRPAELDAPTLAAAEAVLGDWRKAVASWAESESAPVPAAAVGAVVGALEDDLDVGTALAALDRLAADPAVPPGAKFETFAYVDLLLGLDLARDVGR